MDGWMDTFIYIAPISRKEALGTRAPYVKLRHICHLANDC